MDPISRRMWLAGALATLAAVAARREVHAAAVASEERTVGGFDAVLWDAAGELSIAQANRDRLTVEAEPAVLARIVTEVRQRRLHIGFAPGHLQTRQPIRFRLELKTLVALETRGSGSVRIGPLVTTALSLRMAGSEDVQLAQLNARTLDARLEGSGELVIEGGQVDHQHVVIAGAANYTALRMASRQAEVAIDGSGELRVAVAERLDARITGSGNVFYRGQPRVLRTVTGAGEVRPADDEGR